jgi:hypothetical protein
MSILRIATEFIWWCLNYHKLSNRFIGFHFCEVCGSRELNQAVKGLLAEMLEKR